MPDPLLWFWANTDPLLWFWANRLIGKVWQAFYLMVARKKRETNKGLGTRLALLWHAPKDWLHLAGPSLQESYHLKQHSDDIELSTHGPGRQSIHHGPLGIFRWSLNLPYSSKDWTWTLTHNEHVFYTDLPWSWWVLKYAFQTSPPVRFSQGMRLTMLSQAPLQCLLSCRSRNSWLTRNFSPRPRTIWTSTRMTIP